MYVAAAHGALIADNAFDDAGRTLDYRHLPHVAFTAAQIAAVGLTEEQAALQGPGLHLPRADPGPPTPSHRQPGARVSFQAWGPWSVPAWVESPSGISVTGHGPGGTDRLLIKPTGGPGRCRQRRGQVR